MKSRLEFLNGSEDPSDQNLLNSEKTLKKPPAANPPVKQPAPAKPEEKPDPQARTSSKTNVKKLDIKAAGTADQIPKDRIPVKKPSAAPKPKEDSEDLSPPPQKAPDALITQPKETSTEAARASQSASRLAKMDLEIRRVRFLEEMKEKDREKLEAEKRRAEAQKRLEDRERARLEEMKRQVKERKEEREREKQAQFEKERKLLEEKDRARRERSQQFLKEKKKELKVFFDQEAQKREKKSLEVKDRLAREKEKEEKLKSAIESNFKNDREKMLREQQYNEKLISILNSPATKDSLSAVEMQVRYIFGHYCELLKDPVYLQSKLQNKNDILHYRNFIAFANQFNLVPTLVKLPEIKVMYRSCTRHKSLDDDTPIGLDFRGFQEMLVRIAAKKQAFFTDIGAKTGDRSRASSPDKNRSKSGEKVSLDVLDQSVNDFSSVRGFEDNYANIEDWSPKAFDGLLSFLEIPRDKNSLVDKLNSLRKENRRTVSQRERVMEVKRKYGLDRKGETSRARSESENPALSTERDKKPLAKPEEPKAPQKGKEKPDKDPEAPKAPEKPAKAKAADKKEKDKKKKKEPEPEESGEEEAAEPEAEAAENEEEAEEEAGSNDEN